MSGFIWVLFVAGVVIGEVVKARKRSERTNATKPNVPRKNYSTGVQQNNYNRPQQGYPQQGNYNRPQQGYAQQGNSASNTYAMQQKQRELKQKLQQKFGNVSQGNAMAGRTGASTNYNRPMQHAPQRPGDILSRASANVAENAKDVLEHSRMKEPCQDASCVHETGELGVINLANGSELMRQLNDLMIMGYQPDMSAQRDFVAEGVEMLNQYEL